MMESNQDSELQGCYKEKSMLGMDIDRNEDDELCFFMCEVSNTGKMYQQYYPNSAETIVWEAFEFCHSKSLKESYES